MPDLSSRTPSQYSGLMVSLYEFRGCVNEEVRQSSTLKHLGLVAGLLLASPLLSSEFPGWQSVTDGKTLNGWRPDGNAEWSVQNEAIVGRQGRGAAGGSLYTIQQWGNFDLDLEFKVRWPANSGIWFRRTPSQSGYQADILDQASYPNTFSGSLYAMGSGFVAKNTDAASVNREGWNRLRITAACESIVITMNDKTVIKTRDNRFFQPGSVGIEVHPGNQFQGMEISVRHVRIRLADCK